MLAYEAADKTIVPPQNAILLAGDSQFYRWKIFNEDLLEATRSSTEELTCSRRQDLVFFRRPGY